MTEHDNIYLQPLCCVDPEFGQTWCDTDSPVDCEDGVPWTRYIRHDLHEAAIAENHEQARLLGMSAERELRLAAERDELRRDHAAALRLVADLRFALGDDGRRMQPELIKYAKQLRARLDAACEWVPVAEADLRDGEKVDLMQTDPKFHRHDCIYRSSSDEFMLPNGIDLHLPASMVSHILRIKPPASGVFYP